MADKIYGLSWDEASALARSEGTPIRRFPWEMWLSCPTGGLWWFDHGTPTARVVSATEFGRLDFLARDYTTAPWGEFDVCSRVPAQKPEFVPPIVTMTADLAGDTLTITGQLSEGTFGAYTIEYLINGEVVGTDAATDAGAFARSFPFEAENTWGRATFRAKSNLPLPGWTGEASTVAGPEEVTIDLYDLFPYAYLGTTYYGEQVIGPYPVAVWLYSSSVDPVGVDDDFVVDGGILEPGLYPFSGGVNGAHYLGGGGTFVIKYLAVGRTCLLDVRNNFGSGTGASGTLRMRRTPPPA